MEKVWLCSLRRKKKNLTFDILTIVMYFLDFKMVSIFELFIFFFILYMLRSLLLSEFSLFYGLVGMAAMARHRPGGSGGDAAEDDIAAIAKQISDTAEVIYQNWKSRNLAPADLITCHGAGDTAKFG